jgi:SHS2 domain-containing protein
MTPPGAGNITSMRPTWACGASARAERKPSRAYRCHDRSDPARVEGRERVQIECEAPDDELLLAAWLNALVYEMSTRKMLFGRFHVRFDGTRLAGEAWGEPVDVALHDPVVEVKGATYTTLHVGRANGGWVAQTVVDV